MRRLSSMRAWFGQGGFDVGMGEGGGLYKFKICGSSVVWGLSEES